MNDLTLAQEEALWRQGFNRFAVWMRGPRRLGRTVVAAALMLRPETD
jgi:hypothetical protein